MHRSITGVFEDGRGDEETPPGSPVNAVKKQPRVRGARAVAWCGVCVERGMVCGAWRVERGVRCVVWCVVRGVFVVCGMWCMVCGVVRGVLYLARVVCGV